MRTPTRRNFVRGGAATAIALPFLRILNPRSAHAAAPKRVIFFATPNGTVMNDWWPGAGNAYGTILKPLEAHKAKLLVMRGIDMKSAAKIPIGKDHLPDFHNSLTGFQTIGADYGQTFFGGPSLDQVLGQTIGLQTKFSVLNLGVQADATNFAWLSSGNKRIVLPENSPFKAFTRLFAGVTAAPGAVDKLKAERKSILDLVNEELGGIRCELGTDAKVNFDAHVESIRELERSLDFQAPVDKPATCVSPTLGDPIDVKANPNFPMVGKLQMDLVAAAVACDLTRVITLQWSGGASTLAHSWLGITGSHHGISHNSEGVNEPEAKRIGWLVQIETWFAQQFEYLVKKLDSIQEDGGTALDHTALIWLHEQSNGGSHQRTDMPYVLAGGCSGFFKTGRSINLGGKAHNGLLISLANAVGHPITAFGDPEFSAGPIGELR